MARIVVEVPDPVVEALRVPPGEAAARLRQELAVRLYEKGILSFGKARELARMSWWEFHELLGKEQIARSYDVEELEADLETLEQLP